MPIELMTLLLFSCYRHSAEYNDGRQQRRHDNTAQPDMCDSRRQGGEKKRQNGRKAGNKYQAGGGRERETRRDGLQLRVARQANAGPEAWQGTCSMRLAACRFGQTQLTDLYDSLLANGLASITLRCVPSCSVRHRDDVFFSSYPSSLPDRPFFFSLPLGSSFSLESPGFLKKRRIHA